MDLAEGELPFSYDDESVENDAIECPICYCPLIDPVEHQSLNQCAQLFCRLCVEKLDKCPFCRMAVPKWDTVTLTPATLKFIFRPLGELKVSCKVCKQSTTRKDIVNHVESCKIVLPAGLTPRVEEVSSSKSLPSLVTPILDLTRRVFASRGNTNTNNGGTLSSSNNTNNTNPITNPNTNPNSNPNPNSNSINNNVPPTNSTLPPVQYQISPSQSSSTLSSTNSSPMMTITSSPLSSSQALSPPAPQASAPQAQDLQYQSQINSPYSHLAPKPTGPPLPPPPTKDYQSMFYPQQQYVQQQQPNPNGYYFYPPKPSAYMYGQPIYPNVPYTHVPMQSPQPSAYFYGYPQQPQTQPQAQSQQPVPSPVTITSSTNPNGKVSKQTKSSIPAEFQHIYLQAMAPRDRENFSNKAFTTSLTNEVYRSATFRNIKFNNINISNCQFINCTFNDCQFIGTAFTNNTFTNCKVGSCDMSNSVHAKTYYVDSFLTNVNFFQSSGISNIFAHCKLTNVNYSRSNLTGSLFKYTKISNSNLSNCCLLYTNFPASTLLHTNLSESEISIHSLNQVKRQIDINNKGLKVK